MNKIIVVIFIAVAVFSCNEEETVAEMRQRGMIDAGVDTPYIEDQVYRGQDYPPYRVLSLDSFACAATPGPAYRSFSP